jgi:hypothetical protein
VWKLVLGYLPKERKKWSQQMAKQEQAYQTFVNLYLSPDKYVDAPLIMGRNHPEWKTYESDYQLWEQI